MVEVTPPLVLYGTSTSERNSNMPLLDGATLHIHQAGSQVLHTRTADVTPEEIRSNEMRQLVELMRETMRTAPGVGLAAPQIGIGRSIIVIEDRAEYQASLSPQVLMERGRVPVPFAVYFNPQIRFVQPDLKSRVFFEGCLSVAGYMAAVARHVGIAYAALDHNGEEVAGYGEGWFARILQHEVDHLHGWLYTARMIGKTFCTEAEYRARFANLTTAEALAEFGVS